MKDRIRTVSGELFAAQGFSATSVRDIAREADVDPATVIRYFGSKEGLFLATMVLPDDWREVLAGPIETLAADYLRLILDQNQAREGGAILAALVRSSDRPEVADALRSYTQQIFEEGVQPRLEGALWVSVDEVLASVPPERLVELYAPSLQLLLTPTH
jgi:AcrR family transcriptional regulator